MVFNPEMSPIVGAPVDVVIFLCGVDGVPLINVIEQDSTSIIIVVHV